MAPARPDAEAVIRQLWRLEESGEPPAVFALLDAARDPEIYPLVRDCRLDYRCLFQGELHPNLARTAPYLIDLGPGSAFTRELIERGWGKSWGIFGRSAAILQDLRRHFRKFLQVRDGTTGRTMFFRFYDPRVLRLFLPTCERPELEQLFGPVDAFCLEGEAPGTLLELSLQGGELAQRTVPLA